MKRKKLIFLRIPEIHDLTTSSVQLLLKEVAYQKTISNNLVRFLKFWDSPQLLDHLSFPVCWLSLLNVWWAQVLCPL